MEIPKPDGGVRKLGIPTVLDPNRRPIEPKQTSDAALISQPRLGGLHHRYMWRQAGQKAWRRAAVISVFRLMPGQPLL
jgi:hypothetical protein